MVTKKTAQHGKPYIERVKEMDARLAGGFNAAGLSGEDIVRNQIMNELEGQPITGLEIARRNARIMRKDMAAYQNNHSKFTRSLGAATGFMAQQYMIAAKKAQGNLDGIYVYGSGWQWAAMSSTMSPLPDVSSHPKDTVPKQIEEIYRFLRQAGENELLGVFKEIDAARQRGASETDISKLYAKVDNFDSLIRPIVADIDAGFGDPAATYELARKMIQAGACCIQLENQVSDLKQCGHQDGKVTCPREEYLAKIRAVRLAFETLGVPEGVIVARTDSLGAGLTKDLASGVSPYGSDYNKHLEMQEVTPGNPAQDGDVTLTWGGKLMKPTRLPNGLYKFKAGSGFDRAVEDAVFAKKAGGADLIWIETEKANLKQITALSDAIRKEVPDLMLAYNNSPSFAWTLNSRQIVLKHWIEEGNPEAKNYPDPNDATKAAELSSAKYDDTPLGKAAADYIRHFQENVACDASVFHNLITLPEFHLSGLNGQALAEGYFGGRGMDAYVSLVQDREFREKRSSVAHQRMSGSDLTDRNKKVVGGEDALVAAGKDNTQNTITALLHGEADKDEPAVPKQKAVGE